MKPQSHSTGYRRRHSGLLWAAFGAVACLSVGIAIVRSASAGTHASFDWMGELLTPGFLFIVAMCLWLLRRPKSMLPLYGLGFFLVLPLLGGICGTTLHFMDIAIPLKWDAVLYRIDAGLGFSPSWTVGKWFSSDLGHAVMKTVYEIWAVMVVICWLLHRTDWKGRPNRLLVCYGFNLVLGCSLFVLVPACGPIYAYPHFPEIPSAVTLGLMPVSAFPNSIPSLHVSGALILLFYGLQVGNRWWKPVWWLYAGGTALSTLALGEHYLIDLVLAVPFAAFAVWAIEREGKRAVLAFGAVVGSLLAIRYGSSFLIAHPWLVWNCAGALVGFFGYGLLIHPAEKNVQRMAERVSAHGVGVGI